MDATMIGFLILLLFVLCLAWTAWRESRGRRARFLQNMIQAWGKIPDREYSWEELEKISQYFRQREKKGFYIDDITWNDLNMDQVFALLNQCLSPVGDACLYDMLRKPVFDKETLEERNRLMDFFRENQAARHKLQQLLIGIRKPGSSSFYEAVHVTQEVTVQGSGVQLAMCLGFFLSLLFFAIKPDTGVFFLLGMSLFNIGSYFVKKQEVDVYLSSFRCVIQLLSAQKELEKLRIPQLEAYTLQAGEYARALSKFKRGNFLVVDRSSAGGGLEGFFLDYVRMLTHLDLIKFYDMLKAMQENTEALDGLMEIFGTLDALISAASFRESLPYYTVPNLEEGEKAYIRVKNLYHPLLSDPVANSIEAREGILITGSNASGKSTFLKNIAVNAILAQTIYTAVATSYEAPYFKIMTSMALRDDLQGGESYFIVEIRSLKRILEESEKEGCLLCIVDEVLRGTNTIERIGASSRILAALQREKVLPFAATHDIELSYILEKRYENYHFEEEITQKEVVFNYLLKKGRVTTRNAIRLLEMTGYDKELANQAKSAVSDFEKTGIWKVMEK